MNRRGQVKQVDKSTSYTYNRYQLVNPRQLVNSKSNHILNFEF